MSDKNENTATKVITPKCTLSYPHIAEPQPAKGNQKPKFSGAFVFAPGADLSPLVAAAIAAAEAKWPGKGKDMLAKGSIRSPFRKDAEAKGYEAGSVFINARSEQQPGCVYAHAGPDGKPVVIPQDKIVSELYPGAQVRASLRAFAYDTEGNRGVSFALNNIQKLGEGKRLDSRVAPEDEFDADLSDAPADISGIL